MSVTLDRYSKFKAPVQGRVVQKLVSEQRDWLKEFFPGTVERYRDYPHAVKNVARLAASEALYAYVVRVDNAARGIATIIFDQTVLHPIAGEFHGNDLDYWLAPPASKMLHTDVAMQLTEASARRNELRQGGSRDHSVIAAIKVDQPNPPLGLTKIMYPVGSPAFLTTPTGEDPFGVTKGGAIVQLYHWQD